MQASNHMLSSMATHGPGSSRPPPGFPLSSRGLQTAAGQNPYRSTTMATGPSHISRATHGPEHVPYFNFVPQVPPVTASMQTTAGGTGSSQAVGSTWSHGDTHGSRHVGQSARNHPGPSSHVSFSQVTGEASTLGSGGPSQSGMNLTASGATRPIPSASLSSTGSRDNDGVLKALNDLTSQFKQLLPHFATLAPHGSEFQSTAARGNTTIEPEQYGILGGVYQPGTTQGATELGLTAVANNRGRHQEDVLAPPRDQP